MQQTQEFTQSQIQSTNVSSIRPISIKYEDENKSLQSDASSKSKILYKNVFSIFEKNESNPEHSKQNSMSKALSNNSVKSTSSSKNKNKNFLTSTQINESPKNQSNNLNQSPIQSSGNKKRLRPAESDKAVTPNLKIFEYSNSKSKYKNKPKNLDKDWVCVDDDISYIKLDNSSSSQEDLEKNSDDNDDFEMEFSRIKKEKQRKLIEKTNKTSNFVDEEEKEEKENEVDDEDELDFDQNADTQIDPRKYITKTK
jgi:hypothetical protein